MSRKVIGRRWHGRVPAEKLAEYRDYIERTGIPDYRKTPGNINAMIFTWAEGDIGHIETVALWDSYDSIKAFAGDDISKPRYFPLDKDYLLELEPVVQHFEAIVDP